MSETLPVDISFAMACYNASAYLDQAVASALDQRGVRVEVIIVDDGSIDNSLQLANNWAARDSRVKVFQTPRNSGAGGARNVAIDAMQGTWYAVLDCDDLVAPQRTRFLIDTAEAVNADLIADDLEVFGEGLPATTFLSAQQKGAPGWISIEDYFAATVMFGKQPNLGFLKPIIRASTLKKTQIRYNPNLRIAEDDEFAVKLLLAGCRYYLHPEPLYKYRKHSASTSHRLSLKNAQKMLASEEAIASEVEAAGKAGTHYKRRLNAMRRMVAFTQSIDALKARDFAAATRAVLANPFSILLYRMPVQARLSRLFK